MSDLTIKQNEDYLGLQEKKILEILEQTFRKTGSYPSYRTINSETNYGLPLIFEKVSQMSDKGYIQKDEKGRIIGVLGVGDSEENDEIDTENNISDSDNKKDFTERLEKFTLQVLQEKADEILENNTNKNYDEELIDEQVNKIGFACLVEQKDELWNKIFEGDYIFNQKYGIIMKGTFDNNFVNIKVRYNDERIEFPADMRTIMRQIMFKEELVKICNLTLQGFDSIIEETNKFLIIEYSGENAINQLKEYIDNVKAKLGNIEILKIFEIYNNSEYPSKIICRCKQNDKTEDFEIGELKKILICRGENNGI